MNRSHEQLRTISIIDDNAVIEELSRAPVQSRLREASDFPDLSAHGEMIDIASPRFMTGLRAHLPQWAGMASSSAFLLDGPYKDGAVNHNRAVQIPESSLFSDGVRMEQ